ncbi:hypothetical protein V2G26_011521 [Clonostachys chloroleuca]
MSLPRDDLHPGRYGTHTCSLRPPIEIIGGGKGRWERAERGETLERKEGGRKSQGKTPTECLARPSPPPRSHSLPYSAIMCRILLHDDEGLQSREGLLASPYVLPSTSRANPNHEKGPSCCPSVPTLNH